MRNHLGSFSLVSLFLIVFFFPMGAEHLTNSLKSATLLAGVLVLEAVLSA